MKASEVDETILAEYARLDDPSDIELNELKRMRESAVAMITAYTGLEAAGRQEQTGGSCQGKQTSFHGIPP